MISQPPACWFDNRGSFPPYEDANWVDGGPRLCLANIHPRLPSRLKRIAAIFLAGWAVIQGEAQVRLISTNPLETESDLSAEMVAGVDRFLARETTAARDLRHTAWKRALSDPASRGLFRSQRQEHLRRILGVTDPRHTPTEMEYVSGPDHPPRVGGSPDFDVEAVRWEVLQSVYGEGLWLRPKGPTRAYVVALPDADQPPERVAGLAPGAPTPSQFARRLAEQGCEVVVPTLLDRQDTFSGNPAIPRFTNQPHREWIYRQAFELGRHVIGYEVQKVLAGVEFFRARRQSAGSTAGIGIAGYGEGGLLALCAGALEPVDAVWVSGYFQPREQLWQEPIYRNVFGLLESSGDAEIATMIAPRALVVEHSPTPVVNGPPTPRAGRSGAAPGRLCTPPFSEVRSEWDRAVELVRLWDSQAADAFALISGENGEPVGPGSDAALAAFMKALGIPEPVRPPAADPQPTREGVDPLKRQARQVRQLEALTQRLFQSSEAARDKFFWNQMDDSTPEIWRASGGAFRNILWQEVVGRFPDPTMPANARSRRILDHANTTGYEVVIDVYPDVFAWGYLLVPKGIREPRPVVVCFHGLEGLPASVVDVDPASQSFGYYKAFALRLAERGFIVFAPHNPYRGGDAFQQLQRRANPLGKSLFSVIAAQQQQVLSWLRTRPEVDPARIGCYGLSYGGKTAMRIPALLEGFAVSVCSADFNEWVRKNVSLDFPASYMFTGEYEMPEWNLGHTFNYAEMAALIAPRPFMVERGHDDGVGLDEWVAYEYAKVRRLYTRLGIPDHTRIEYFPGPHTIHGVGTFEFLHRHLNWPAPP